MVRQKYAILISEDTHTGNYPDFPQFWFDLILVRELLLEHGFEDKNVFVFHGRDGKDLDYRMYRLPRYRPSPPITRFPATKESLHQVFNSLRHGLNGLPRITEHDLVVVWMCAHGDGPGSGHQESQVSLAGKPITESTFADFLDQIPYEARVVCVNACYSGGFVNALKNDKTVVITACDAQETAKAEYTENCDFEHTQEWGRVTYLHWAFTAQLHAAFVGKTILGKPANADVNGDKLVSLREAYEFIRKNNSQNEKAQFDDGANHLGDSLNLYLGGRPPPPELTHFIGNPLTRRVHTKDCFFGWALVGPIRVPFQKLAVAFLEGYKTCIFCRPTLDPD